MSQIQLINPYHANIPLRNFANLDEQLNKYYDYISDYDPTPPGSHTPRAKLGDFRSTSRDIFYYISWLYDNKPNSVIDFGCGECFWKKWFPNMFGVDIKQWCGSQADLIIPIWQLSDFFASNKEKFDCGMAINSVHFGTFDVVENNIHKCMTLIKDNGRFLFTINLSIVYRHMTGIFDDIKSDIDIDKYKLDCYSMIQKTGYKILMLDMPKIGQANGINGINGDMRFVLEK